MNEEKTAEQEQEKEWRRRMKELGRRAFEMEEMERLGFWPPDDATRVKTERIRQELRELQNQLSPLRSEAYKLEKTITQSSDIASLLAEVRTRRIERVKAERAARKERRTQEAIERAAKDKQWRAQTLPHLGREVSRGLKYEGGEDSALQALGLPILHSPSEISAAMKIENAQLAWLCYHRGATTVDHYIHFQINAHYYRFARVTARVICDVNFGTKGDRCIMNGNWI